ncbi:hypothetical protein ES706_06158 [subsurface metagenome]
MAFGDIGSIIESFEYDTESGKTASVLKLDTGIVAIWYLGTGADMWVKTYPVDAAGDIGALIDSWDFHPTTSNGAYYHPFVVKTAGNVYVVCYRGQRLPQPPYETWLNIMTMTVAPDGTITKTAIEYVYFAGLPDPTKLSGFIRKTGTTKYVAFFDSAGVDPDGHIAVFNVNDNGTGVALTDSWLFDAIGESPSVIHISGDIFAISYNNGTNAVLKTFSVNDAGAITKAWIDTETIQSSTIYPHKIEHVAGSVYAVFSEATSTVRTYTIAGDGAITALSSGNFSAVALLEIRVLAIGTQGANTVFLVGGRTSWDGKLSTVPISDAGVVGAIIDAIDIHAGQTQFMYNHSEPQDGIYLISWSDTPAADGFIDTIDVDDITAIPRSQGVLIG